MFKAQHYKKLAEQFWNEVLNEQNYELVPKLLSPDYKFNGVATPPPATIGWVKSLHQKYPDLKFTIEDILADEHKVALRWRLTATDPASGLRGYHTGTNIIVFKDDQAITNDQGGGTEWFPLPPEVVPAPAPTPTRTS